MNREGKLVLADFGYAASISARPSGIAGSPCYAAPEVFTREAHGKGVDMWSTAALLAEFLFGRRIFDQGLAAAANPLEPYGAHVAQGLATQSRAVAAQLSSRGWPSLGACLSPEAARRPSALEVIGACCLWEWCGFCSFDPVEDRPLVGDVLDLLGKEHALLWGHRLGWGPHRGLGLGAPVGGFFIQGTHQVRVRVTTRGAMARRSACSTCRSGCKCRTHPRASCFGSAGRSVKSGCPPAPTSGRTR